MSIYHNPVHIEFGRGSIDFLHRYIQNSKVLLVTSAGFEKRGLVNKLRDENKNIIKVINHIQPNPTLRDILTIRQQLDYDKFDKIVALGGGSVIDAAKALSVYGVTDEEFQNLVFGKLTNNNFDVKNLVAIPTTAGTGSEVTMWGTIWDDINKLKYSISNEKLYCETAILDPLLHSTIPLDLTIQTGLDALSHSLEALWNKNSNYISDKYAICACRTIVEVLPELAKDLSNVHLREKMLEASYRAGLAFSNTQTALAHAMSYYMTSYKGVPHGIAASFTLSVITEYAMEIEFLRKKLELAVGSNPVQVLNELMEKLGVSRNPKDYNIMQQDWIEILKTLNNSSRAENSLINPSKVIKHLMKVE